MGSWCKDLPSIVAPSVLCRNRNVHGESWHLSLLDWFGLPSWCHAAFMLGQKRAEHKARKRVRSSERLYCLSSKAFSPLSVQNVISFRDLHDLKPKTMVAEMGEGVDAFPLLSCWVRHTRLGNVTNTTKRGLCFQVNLCFGSNVFVFKLQEDQNALGVSYPSIHSQPFNFCCVLLQILKLWDQFDLR